MATIARTAVSPKGGNAGYPVRETAGTSLNDILAWCRENTSGRVWFQRVQYRDPTSPNHCSNNHQRNFKDGYWMLMFWFSRKADAAVFRLWWGVL